VLHLEGLLATEKEVSANLKVLLEKETKTTDELRAAIASAIESGDNEELNKLSMTS